MANYVVFFVVVSLASIELGSCIKCYQCSSQTNPQCASDNLSDPKFLVDCSQPHAEEFNRRYLKPMYPTFPGSIPGSYRTCHKIVFGKSKNVIRTCLDANASDVNLSCKLIADIAKQSSVIRSGALVVCDACDKDGCNGAVSVAS